MTSPVSSDERPGGLLAWQFAGYADYHRDRRNLLLHVATVPLFWAGTLALAAAPAVVWWLAPAGLLGMALAAASQGRGHAQETLPPAPFRGALDVVARLFVEQWITFPRFVLSGGFARAWRAARER
jgi:hypothetical protein